MPRPIRCRRVRAMPGICHFKPAGRRMTEIDEVVLSVEEYEAIKLVDYEQKDQKSAAEQMNVSQPTLHRILLSARKKIADALSNGKAIKIEGGNFALPGRNQTHPMRGQGMGRMRRF